MDKKFYSVKDIRRHYDQWTSGHWFGADEMRFFGTRLLGDTYGEDGSIFITSEQRWGDDSRTYGIRWYDWREIPYTDNESPRGCIESGPRFATAYQAKKFARSLSVKKLQDMLADDPYNFWRNFDALGGALAVA